MHPDTLAVHAAPPDPHSGEVAPPLRLSTTFARDEQNVLLGGHNYIRESNPTQELLEAALATLEGGEAALAFAAIGWGWGGSWSRAKDYQHFSSTGR